MNSDKSPEPTGPDPPDSRLSDEELFKRYVETRSPELLGEIHRRFREPIYRYCLKRLGNEHDAEDAVQSTFAVLPKRVETLKADNLRAYLFKIARYSISEIVRSRHPAVSLDEYLEATQKLLARHQSAPEDAEPDPRLLDVWHAVDELSDTHREVLTLYYKDRIGAKKLASQLGITVGAVHQRLARARRSLCETLIAAGTPGLSPPDPPP